MEELKKKAEALYGYPMPDKEMVDLLLEKEVSGYDGKIIVLDDDPTGVQTVQDVSVYTDWSVDSIRKGFEEKNRLFFLLTNSRGFTVSQTTKAHTEIAENVDRVAKEQGRNYLMISRSDSTLRGHYPLETEVLRECLEARNDWMMDGEILCPFFKEGGRFTLDNIHYVKYGEELVPAGQTEFAGDETFGYRSSNLCEYVEEKTKGAFHKEDCICITLEMLRTMDISAIENLLFSVKGFHKIIVNAIDSVDVKIFCIALYRAMAKGKHYLIRCAAALVKEIGQIPDHPLLARTEMVRDKKAAGGIIVVGSHTKKTTAQLEELKKLNKICFIEMNSNLVLEGNELDKETERILQEEERLIQDGTTVCVSTKRTLLKLENDTPEEALVRSVKISDALKDCVGKLKVTPSFVVAKGGITSSDVGIKALRVKKAKVLGQIQPGIPVWQTGEESLFPGIPYIIFPGNVGNADTLKKAVEILL